MANTPVLKINREQLAKFLPDPETIKQFERLFAVAETIAPNVPQELDIEAGLGISQAENVAALVVQLTQYVSTTNAVLDAKANEAIAAAQQLKRDLELLITQPRDHQVVLDEQSSHNYYQEQSSNDIDLLLRQPKEQPQVNNDLGVLLTKPKFVLPNTIPADAVEFNVNGVRNGKVGQVGWNAQDNTIEISHDYDVNQQVGLELYARVENSTGVTIPNGSVVGFAGVGANNNLSVSLYNADGSVPTLYVLGIMTHDLPNSGQVGFCTVWGHVRGLDTSAFTQGDILYCDPTTPGGLTNVKPTAADAVVPIAAVLQVDATDGEIFVRPTIEQQQYYGTFSDTTTQTAAAVYTPYPVAYDTTDIANGFSRTGSPVTQILAANSGFYNFQFSLQVSSTSANAQKIWVFPRVNGSDIPNSGSEATISGGGTELVLSWNWTISMNAGDYFELMFAVDNTNVQLFARAAQTGSNGTATFARPAVPSVILTVTQVQQ